MNMPLNIPDFGKLAVARPWPHVLGIDIGTETIKYVLIRRHGGKVLIEAFGRIMNPLTEEADFSRLSEAIQKIPVHPALLKKVRTVVGFSPSGLVTRRESYPLSVSAKELRQMVAFDMEKEMAAAETGGILSDFLAIGPSPEKEGQMMYLLAALPGEDAEMLSGALVQAGITPVKITPHITAFRNLSTLLPPEIHTGVTGVLDIGRGRSKLVILRNGQLDYYRDILVGGADFTKAITSTIFHEGRAIQFSTAEANNFKKLYGYPIGYSEGMTYKGAPLAEVGAMMRPVMERLSGEVHRSLGFFIEKHQGEKIRVLYLVGGGGQLKHLSDFLSEKIDVPVQNFPASKLISLAKVKKQKDLFVEKQYELAGSLALALEGAGPINLLPAPYRKIHRMAAYRQALNYSLVAAIALMAFLSLFGTGRKSALEREIIDLNRRATHNRNMAAMHSLIDDSIKTVQGQIADVDAMVKTDEDLTQILRLVTHALPRGLSLTLFASGKEAAAAAKQERPARGAAAAQAAKPRERRFVEVWGQNREKRYDIKMATADFVYNLEKSGYFSSVAITKEYMLPDSLHKLTYEFQLKAYLDE
ncbi:MAG TPA: hypothetical protein ENN17_01095 [bacterium]|nr:hypothetical protein [bacterium]